MYRLTRLHVLRSAAARRTVPPPATRLGLARALATAPPPPPPPHSPGDGGDVKKPGNALGAALTGPAPPAPRAKRRGSPVWAAVCVISVLFGVTSELWWYRFSPHRGGSTSYAPRDGGSDERIAPGTASIRDALPQSSSRGVHAEGFWPFSRRRDHNVAHGGENGSESSSIAAVDDGHADRITAERIQYLATRGGASLFSLYARRYAGEDDPATLTADDAVRALARALPSSRLPESDVRVIASLAEAASRASGRTDGRLGPCEFDMLKRLLTTPMSAYTLAFRLFDGNHNGTLSFAEMRSALSTISFSSTPASRSDVAAEEWAAPLIGTVISADQSAFTLGEFTALLESVQSSLRTVQYAAHATRRDGAMSASDFAWYLALSWPRNDPDVMLEQLRKIEAKHGPAGSTLSLQEFAAFDSLMHQMERFGAALRILYNVNDADVPRDRSLEQQVFDRACHACEVKLSPYQLDVIVSLFDLNGDGRLSFSEFLAMAESHVTQGLLYPPASSDTISAQTRAMGNGALEDWSRSFENLSFGERVAAWWDCLRAGGDGEAGSC
ncbi:hypothetical protein H9P43_004658 [Blastocladiella emersonii ATCC 22665]|nr:hypothetical protein H9P43_004658 [Blastocladiella emersonii ATCC 22665]